MNELNEALKTYREKGFVVVIDIEEVTLAKMVASIVLAVVLGTIGFYVVKNLFSN